MKFKCAVHTGALQLGLLSTCLTLIIKFTSFSLALSIKCWDCNSLINGGCGDPFVQGDFAQADCSQKHLSRFPDKVGHFCRKTTQKSKFIE